MNPAQIRSSVLSACNPQKNLYFCCYKFEDYFKAPSELQTLNKGLRSQAMFVLVSKFPFFEFHKQVLTELYTSIVNFRKTRYQRYKDQKEIFIKLIFEEILMVKFF